MSPARRRRQIVDAAGVLLEARDPLDVTFEEVAEAAGVSRGLVYRYFGDKGGLVAAVYLRSSTRFDTALDDVISHTLPPEERLAALVRGYLSLAERDPGAFRRFATLAAVHHPKVEAARDQRLRRIAARWGGTDEAAVLARCIVCLLESATLQWLDHGWPDRHSLARTLTRFLWGGVAAFDADGLVVPAGATRRGDGGVPS